MKPNAVMDPDGLRRHSGYGSSPGDSDWALSGSSGSSGESESSGSSGESGEGRAAVLRARLMLDCMGHYSPIVKQMRGRAKPEGMLMVVSGILRYG